MGFRRKEDIGLVWLLITLMWVIKKLPLIQSKKKKKLPLMVNGLFRIINGQFVPRLALNIGQVLVKDGTT